MATSNVSFYQRQKDLQDQVTKSEQERIKLEKQYKLLIHSDQNSAQLKATKLRAYWQKICADEKRAQQRNAMLVREFERIDAHLASMNARTQRLDFLKRQYADHIAQMYPEWTKLVEKRMRGETQQVNTSADIQTQQDAAVGQQSLGGQPGIQRSQEWTEAEKEESISVSPSISGQHQQQHQGHHYQPENHKPFQQEIGGAVQSSGSRVLGELGSGKTSHKTQSASIGQPAPIKIGDITNISARSNSTYAGTNYGASAKSAVGGGAHSLPDGATDVRGQKQQNPHQQNSPAASEYANISQYSKPPAAQSTFLHHKGYGDMQPLKPGEDVDDNNELNFESDDDLLLSGGDTTLARAQGRKRQSLADSGRSLRSSGSLLPELTVEGLIRLLHRIETSISRGETNAGYYQSPIFSDMTEKIDVIQRANVNGALEGLTGVKASSLVLEQLSHVVRNLPEACLIGEGLLKRDPSLVTASTIGDSLTGEAQELWIAIFTHFNRLLEGRVMGAKEIACIFVPCLVADRSHFQDKALTLLVKLLEPGDATDTSSMASPRHLSSPHHHLQNSGSLMENSRVPPLKFGSMLDKPFSDDEISSFVDQSSAKEPAIPLNETAAYKLMLSGSNSKPMQKVVSDDTDDDVDDVLSPDMTRTKPVTPRPTSSTHKAASVSEAESVSEAAVSGHKSPVYVPTAVEQRPGSMFGSTGSSQGLRRTGGLNLGSDLDYDSDEIEPGLIGSSKKSTFDDFFD